MRGIRNKYPIVLVERNERASRIVKVAVLDSENRIIVALMKCHEQRKFVSLIHVIFFMKAVLCIVSITVSVCDRGEAIGIVGDRLLSHVERSIDELIGAVGY